MKQKEVVNHLWKRGTDLQQGLQKTIQQMDLPIEIRGYPYRLLQSVKDESGNDSLLLKSILYQECIEKGILFGPGAILHSYSHNVDDTSKTIEVFSQAGEMLQKAMNSPDPSKFLKGNVMKPVLKFPV